MTTSGRRIGVMKVFLLKFSWRDQLNFNRLGIHFSSFYMQDGYNINLCFRMPFFVFCSGVKNRKTARFEEVYCTISIV